MKKFSIFALVAMFFTACATDQTAGVQPIDAPETLTVSFEEDTRIQLNEAQKTVWTEGDLVSVFYKSDANDCWKFTGETGARTATLQQVSKGEKSRNGDNVIVAYPYNADYVISLSSNTLETKLPAVQNYCANSFGVKSSPMVGVGDYKQFILKNVCGWLKLQLTGNGEKVKSIILEGNNGEQVAGDVLIVADDASLILASASIDVDDTQVGGSLLLEEDILTEVTLDCGEGVTLGSEATAFYIALPPQTFTNGLTVKISDASGIIMTKQTENSIAIERNTIQPMAEFEVKLETESISNITPEAVGSGLEVSLKNVLVTAVGSQAYVIADESGAMIVYHLDHGRSVGEMINISGQVTVFTNTSGSFGTPQFSSDAVVEVVSTDNEVVYNPEVVSGATFDALVDGKVAKEVELVATWEVSGNFVNLTVDGSSKRGSIKYIDNSQYSSFAGQSVVIKGYYVGRSVSGTNNYVNIMPYSVEADVNSPQLSVDKSEITFAAADDSNARQTFTAITNGFEGYELTWSIDNETDFTLGKQLGNKNRTTLYVAPNTANNSYAKSAYVTVTYTNGETVLTQKVKIIQEGVLTASYTIISNAADLTAGTYYMAAFCETNSNTVDLTPYTYHLFTGSVGSGSSVDLCTVPYQFTNGELTIKEGEANEAVTVVLESTGDGRFYVKNSKDGKYVRSTEAANRKLALVDEPYAWTAEDHANGGVALTDGSVWVGSASATSNFIRSYNASSKHKFGLYFFKQN